MFTFFCHISLKGILGGLLILLICSCLPESRSGDVYSRDQARVTNTVQYGTLVRVEDVTIEGTNTGLGTLAGGALGGALGSAVGSGSGKTIAIIGGAILGSLAGSTVEKDVTTEAGIELEVQLDNGEILMVVQEKDVELKVGERVRVVKDSNGTTRVRPGAP